MVVIAQSDCIRANVVVFGQSVCIRAKVVVFGQKWLYSGNFVLNLFLSGTRGCIRAKWFYLGKVAVFGQTLLYSGKSGCIFSKVLVFGQVCFIWVERL